MAARLDEIAEGIATLLRTSLTPEPLQIDMRGHSPVEVAFFVRALAEACKRLQAPLAVVRIDRDLGERLARSLEVDEPLSGGDTLVELDVALRGSLEVFRHRPAAGPVQSNKSR